MVKKLNNADLEKKGVHPNYYLIYQLWKELTAKKTLDTYQFRIMNTLSALKELVKVINQRLNRFHNSNRNIDDCKNETFEIIKNDLILKEYYPSIQTRLLTQIKKKTDTDSQQKVLLYHLDYVLKILEPQYFDNLIKDLKKNLDNNNIDNIFLETNQLVSCCSSRGWSDQALYNVIDIFHNSNNDSTSWENFEKKLCSSTLDYHILLSFKVRVINAPGQKHELAKEHVLNEINNMGIGSMEKEEILKNYPYLKEMENKIEENTYLQISIQSYDMYSASHLAISKLANILNILSFYHLTEPWSIRDISWFTIDMKNQYAQSFKSKDLYSTYDYLDGANKIFRTSKELDEKADQSIKAKLQATYSYANMGKVSYAQTEKYINTWVALESLCRTEMYENIIENILDTVPPALCLRYIYRRFRNFAEDCVRCNINFEFVNDSVNLKHPSKEDMVKDIIRIMNDNVIYGELYKKCEVNKLLVKRCEDMHLIATDGNQMFMQIDNHYKNVRRQLSRLYRLRNEIAHSALHDETSLIRYIEHLNDYLSKFVAEIVMCWNKNHENSIENIFEMIKDNYKEYVDIKSSKKGANPIQLLEDLRKTGIISLI